MLCSSSSTAKVRRGVIAEKYEDIIARIYSGADHVDIDTVINVGVDVGVESLPGSRRMRVVAPSPSLLSPSKQKYCQSRVSSLEATDAQAEKSQRTRRLLIGA